MMKRCFCKFEVSLDVMGVVFCLLVSSATGDVLGQETSSQATQSEIATANSAISLGKSNGKRWTVHCEREDGSQGIFRVSSDITDEASPLDIESQPAAPQVAKAPPTPKPKIESEPAVAPKDEDPFGSPTLKCGRLLTLLAIFATGESSRH
ncbi:hypothetical protein [Candidatus Nitronereus thalassa]|uniref:Uncharacterized protein n=1 Tax=Candidatus Nitronereus thalassa TaxID=3020898 RepID=A0ABU3K9R7_9BACT|nr:hypothetical protein [Candidatus Nitronereus thalassa]MDT7043159.1 hypothetical protein [Candidatus Nitronereus thalassa]